MRFNGPTPHPISLEFPHHKLVLADITTDAGPRGLGDSLVNQKLDILGNIRRRRC